MSFILILNFINKLIFKVIKRMKNAFLLGTEKLLIINSVVKRGVVDNLIVE